MCNLIKEYNNSQYSSPTSEVSIPHRQQSITVYKSSCNSFTDCGITKIVHIKEKNFAQSIQKKNQI